MNTVFDIITILPVSLLLLMLTGTYAGIPADSPSGYVLCTAFTLFLILLRNMKRKARICSAGITAVFLAGLFLAAGEESRQLFMTEYRWVIRVLCLSALALIAGMLMNRFLTVRRTAAAGMLIACIVCAVLKRSVSKEAFALICFLLMIRLAEEVQRKWKKSGSPDMKAHITRISPFFLAGCLLVYAAPAPDTPYDWQLAKDICHHGVTLAHRVYGKIAHPSDDYAQTGFSESGGFAAGLRGNDDTVLLIRTSNSAIRNYGLAGCIGSAFNGREWSFDSENGQASRLLDTAETVCAVKKCGLSARTDFLQKTDLRYENRFYNTRYMFAPSKIKTGTTGAGFSEFTEKNGSLISEKPLRYEDHYAVSCYMLNYEHPQLAALLNNAAPIDETEWKETAAAEGILNRPGCSFADYQKYRAEIYQNTVRAGSLSADVRAILDEIGSGAANRYEAAKQLEAYLSSMDYDANCGALPDSVTDAERFLDYFLLTARKGYCMHYATAFVLMAGEMGIPCRYVQGYSVRADGHGDITVRQSSAHAWPEVYFDHAGWIAFEPTPGRSVQAGWEIRQNDPSVFYQDQSHAGTGYGQQEADSPPEEAEAETRVIHPLVLLIPSLAVLCFLLLFFIISRSAARRKYRRMDGDEKIRHLTRQNIRLLGYLGFRMQKDETLAEYRSRILQSGRQELRAHLGFIPVCETVLYSGRHAAAEEVQAAEETYQALRAAVKKRGLRFRLMLLLRK